MNIDIKLLKSGREKEIIINQELRIDKKVYKNTELLDLKEIKIIGSVKKSSSNGYDLLLTIEGIMVLPCAITLKEVDYPFYVTIDGNIDEMLLEIDENYEKAKNTIDIFPIIWENILMEIPLRVVSEGANDFVKSGNGWKFVTDEDTENTVNSEFEKLKNLL